MVQVHASRGGAPLAPVAGASALGAQQVRAWVEQVRSAADGIPHGDAPGLLNLASALEDLTRAVSALQGTVALGVVEAVAQREAQASDIPRERAARRVATHELALARRCSPHRAGVLVAAAQVLGAQMPWTRQALRNGLIDERSALCMVAETACLDADTRAEVDRRMCADPARLAGVGFKRLVGGARRLAAELDAAAVVRRNERAVANRGVWLRPAPDSMAYLTALVPLVQGVRMYGVLHRAAESARASGDPRPRGAVMVDTLVETLTGQRAAQDVPVTVEVVMSDAALLGLSHEPAYVAGGGAVPAAVARQAVLAGMDADALWLRKLYADPTGQLIAATSRARFHPEGLAAMIRARDGGVCRTPYCDSPVRQIDHVVPAARGGSTSLENAQGLCVACNLAKEEGRWTQSVDCAGRVVTQTPYGVTAASAAPELPTPLRERESRAGPARYDERSQASIRPSPGSLRKNGRLARARPPTQ